MFDSKENQKFDLRVKKLRFRVQIYSNIGVYFRNVYFLLHSTKLSILNGSAPTESVFLTASSMRWNDLKVKNCMGRKQNGQHLQGWLFSIFRALFIGHVNPKNVHFLFTQMFSKYIKYTKGTIRFFSKVHFHFEKALPNWEHSPF